MSDMTGTVDRADTGWDDYSNRVLRNEARLMALESLVAETRASDRKLIEQRSDSLAQELERRAESLLELVTARADAVLTLGREERIGDSRAIEVWKTEHEKMMLTIREATRRETELALTSLREVQETSMQKNYEQSREAISALEQRRVAATARIEQMVVQWRDSDREARMLFTAELDRHLDSLNHNNERMATFQANSVTRELWQAEKEASITREGLLRDQIIALDRAVLTMTPLDRADKTHADILERMEDSIEAATKVLDNKITVVADKVEDLKTYRDTTQGRSAGYSAFYAWGATAMTILVALIVIFNTVQS